MGERKKIKEKKNKGEKMKRTVIWSAVLGAAIWLGAYLFNHVDVWVGAGFFVLALFLLGREVDRRLKGKG